MKVSTSWLKELIGLNCSIEELINLLPLRTIGTKEVTEDFIELDMKGYNRADLLSMRGVAMEVSAITGSKILFEEPQEAQFAWNQVRLPNIKVEVKDPKLCPFYCLVKIEGLKVKKSPDEWVKKLAESGMRSVDNVTDITNLTMLEYGQPMHAFDADKVADEEIIVRTAKSGEKLVTLDGKTRTLTPTNLLITDKQKALGLAGVMGGENSEVTSSTKTILLEAAIFDPANIRQTAISQGQTSEASKRFQHGLTKKRLLQALDAAIKMYQEIGGKVVAITLAGNFEDRARKITLTKQKLEELVGVKFVDKQVEDYLGKLGFTLASQGQALGAWEVAPPYWRLDVNIEEDVIEEVARMYGYEKIPAAAVFESKPFQKEDSIFKKISDLREALVKAGLAEVQSYSFYSTDVLNALDANKEKLVKVANPISSETEYLRENLWPNLLEVVGKNIRRGYKDIVIFEIGKAFNNINGEPKENYRLAIALMNGTDNPITELFSLANSLNISGTPGLLGNDKLFHPKKITGNMAEVHLRVLNKLGIERRVAILELTLLS